MHGPAAALGLVPIVLAVALLPGGAWVLAAGLSNRSRAETVGTALALSPGLYGGAVALLLAAGVSMTAATGIALAGFALAAAVAGALRGHRRTMASAPPPDARLAWIAAALVAVPVALFPLLSEWWRIYSDSWSHYAITRAVLAGGAHPLDPFYAGLPLQYPWIYHALMASVETATGANVFSLMPVWSSIALVGLLLCAGPIAARLHGRAQGWGLALLVLGLNALYPVLVPILAGKAMVGTVRGWPEIVRTFSLVPFGVSRVTEFLQSLGGQDFFLNKFMLATPFALGLAGYTAFAASLLRWLDHRDRRELWITAGALLAAGLMHPVIALDVIGATLGLAAVAMVAPRWVGLSRGAAAELAVAVVAGALPVVIYTSRIMGGAGGSHREIPIDVSMWKFLGLYSTLALGLLLAVRPMSRLVREGGPRRAWAAWIAITLLIATVIRTPGSITFFTIDKFSYMVWIPLALTAGAELESFLARRGKAAQLAIVLALFVPVTGLALAGRVADPHARARQPWDLPGLVWMRAHLPPDAVLVVPYGDPVTGNYVGRDQYLMDENLAQVLGYPVNEIAARRMLTERLFTTDSLASGDASRLRALGRPVYAVWTRFDDPRLACTPRQDWKAFAGTTLPERPPHWDGRYPVVYASETHVVAELVPAHFAGSSPRPDAAGSPPR